MAQQSQDMADNAADGAQGAIRSTQRAADQALDPSRKRSMTRAARPRP